jgi:lysophospholipase L1-like esterase
MRKIIPFFVALLLMSLAPDQKKIKIFLAGDSTMSIKAEKNFPETGWGMPFIHFWNENLMVVNKAKNGRSTKTFLSEGLWKQIMDEATAGDYVFIQFGHNDEVKSKVNSYTTPEEFTSNLRKYIGDAREKKMIPVLMTPVARRKFDAAGKIEQTHQEYSALVLKVAAEEKLLFIDLDAQSMQLYQQFGVENSKLLFCQLKPGEHPNYPDGKDDNTHFNELGARLIAQLVLKEIRTTIPDLLTYITTKKP